MQRILLALVAGILGGGAGALAVDLARGRPPERGDASAATFPAAEWRDFGERLARIESALPPAAVSGGPTSGGSGMLAGRPEAAPAGSPAEEAHLQRIEERVAAAAEKAFAKMEEAREERSPPAGGEGAPKKRVTLAEAAAEIGLSRGEESDLRRVYEETGERFLKLLAEPDGDVEAVKRDLEGAKSSGGRNVLMAKYLPKMLPKIGDLIALQAERETRVAEVLGPERAARYERFDVVEADPYGLSGNVRMEARATR